VAVKKSYYVVFLQNIRHPTVPDLERVLKSVFAVKFEKQKQKHRNNSIFSKIEMINNSSLF
jgi:hypothetical protein